MGGAALGVGIAGLALQAYGTYNTVNASRTAASQKLQAASFEAAQDSEQATQAVAVAQRNAFSVDRQTQLLQSRALALAAASGGGATDPTVMTIIGNIGGEGSYKKAQALYEGEESARQLRLKASTDLVNGQIGANESLASGRSAAITGAAGMMRTTATLYSKYGVTTPPPSSTGANPVLDAGTPSSPSYS